MGIDETTDVEERIIPLSEPVIAGNEWQYVKECLDAGWVSSAGAFVDRFECELVAFVGASYGVATVTGTAALHVALLSMGVRADDEVLVSDLTFVAPVNAIRYCGAHPVFIDATLDTWQMDAAKVEQFFSTECERHEGACINRRTGRRVSAIVPVHILGLACEIDRIVAVARANGVRVVEDATEALGVHYQGRHVGTFGDAGVFSFNGNKIITSGGGGMVVSDDEACARQVRYLTTQAKDDPVEYDHHAVGFNYRLTNVQAAIGVAQLEQLDHFIERKRTISEAYRLGFSGVDGITSMPRPAGIDSNYWLHTILLKPGIALEDRKVIVGRLREDGIGARPLWHTIHDLQPYWACQSFRIENSVTLYTRAVCLPSGAGLSDEDVERTIDALTRAVTA